MSKFCEVPRIQSVQESGTSWSDSKILSYIRSNPGATVGDVYAHLWNRHASSFTLRGVTESIARMCVDGLVSENVLPIIYGQVVMGKVSHYTITPKGEFAVEKFVVQRRIATAENHLDLQALLAASLREMRFKANNKG